MKLSLTLWLLSFMLKRALRRKPRFREQLERMRGLDWGIATEDLSTARHYRMTPKRITSGKGLPVDLDLELRFRDQEAALRAQPLKRRRRARIRPAREDVDRAIGRRLQQ